MPRILLLNQYYAPDEAATAQMLADLGGGLAAAGFTVTAICCDRSYADPSRRYPARETIDGVDIRRVRTSGFGRTSKLGRITDYLTFLAGAKLQLLTAPKPDVVVSLSTPPMVSLLGTLLGKLRGARTVFWSMDVYPEVAYELGAIKEGSLVGRLVAFLAHLTHRLPDTVVALGETMKAKLEAAGARNVVVIHNWADGDAIHPMPLEENPLRNAWGWSDRFVILYSGNMGLGHEFETALKGIAECGVRSAELASPPRTIIAESPPQPGIAEPQNSAFRIPHSAMPLLAFIGTGPRRAEVEARAAELGLTSPKPEVSSRPAPLPIPHSAFRIPHSQVAFRTPHCEFRPPLPRADLTNSLTAPDVHLVTMRDGMPGLIVPSKIYGILAAGKPTIYVGPSEGEIYEIITSGDCGIHVPLGDAAAFTDAVARYATDRELVAEHGRNARRVFDTRFTRARGIAEFRKALGGRG